MTHTLRADLHVHTWASTVSGNLHFLKSRDCYSAPLDVYRVAKTRGMDLVAITDHDSIDGALELLDRLPAASDVIVGEEVSCRFPDGDIEVHLGVYGMTEQLHRDIQPLRGNVFEVTALLRAHGAFFSLNHLLHFYRGQTPLDNYLRLLDEVPAVEARNGTMVRAHNEPGQSASTRQNLAHRSPHDSCRQTAPGSQLSLCWAVPSRKKSQLWPTFAIRVPDGALHVSAPGVLAEHFS
jgi:hypothetical protein